MLQALSGADGAPPKTPLDEQHAALLAAPVEELIGAATGRQPPGDVDSMAIRGLATARPPAAAAAPVTDAAAHLHALLSAPLPEDSGSSVSSGETSRAGSGDVPDGASRGGSPDVAAEARMAAALEQLSALGGSRSGSPPACAAAAQ